MRHSNLRAFVGCLVIALSGIAYAQDDGAPRVDINLKDADIVAAAQGLTAKTGLQFVFESSAGFSRVTLKLEQVTPDEAIQYICAAAGATYRKDDNGVYLISATAGDSKSPAPLSEAPASAGTAPKDDHIVRRIVMRYSDPYELEMELYGLPSDSSQKWAWLRNYSGMAAYAGLGNNTAPLGSTQNPIPMSPAPAVVDNSVVPRSPSESGSDIQLPGESANQVGGQGFGGGGFGGQGGIGGQGGGNRGGAGGQGGGTLLRPGQGLVPAGLDFITYDPGTNSIIVRGTREAIDQLETYVDMFDQVPKQVTIKVEFVTSSESTKKDLGFDFLYQRGPVSFGTQPGTFANSSDPFFLNYSIGNVTAEMRALLTENSGTTVQAPIIRTLNNEPAVLNDNIETFAVTANSVTTTTGTNTNYGLLTINYPTTLSVDPRINGDGTITMFLAPSIASQGAIDTLPTGNGGTQQLPEQDTQSIQAVIRVKDGQTVVMGGLGQRNNSVVANKFPILGDLPVIGQFFSSKLTNKSNQDLFIFVTPTIVKDEENTGLEPL